MENYKGMFYEKNSTIPNFEGGAHFKYLELFEALKKLKEKQESPNHDITKSEERIERHKKKHHKNDSPEKSKEKTDEKDKSKKKNKLKRLILRDPKLNDGSIQNTEPNNRYNDSRLPNKYSNKSLDLKYLSSMKKNKYFVSEEIKPKRHSKNNNELPVIDSLYFKSINGNISGDSNLDTNNTLKKNKFNNIKHIKEDDNDQVNEDKDEMLSKMLPKINIKYNFHLSEKKKNLDKDRQNFKDNIYKSKEKKKKNEYFLLKNNSNDKNYSIMKIPIL